MGVLAAGASLVGDLASEASNGLTDQEVAESLGLAGGAFADGALAEDCLATLGFAVGGPPGAVIGGVVGALAGGFGGGLAGEAFGASFY